VGLGVAARAPGFLVAVDEPLHFFGSYFSVSTFIAFISRLIADS